MKRLYITDLDGTLLNSKQQLSDYTVDALNRLIAQGVQITFSTARSFYTTSMMLNRVQFQLPCITYNGTYVIKADTGEVIRKNLLSREVFAGVLAMAKSLGLKPYIFGKTAAQEEKLLYEEPEHPAHVQFLEERQKRGDKRLQPAATFIGELTELINCNFLYPLEPIRKLEQRVLEAYGDAVSVKVVKDIYNEGYYTLEVSNKDANKGDMLDYVAGLLQTERQNITVFGDQANDKEMFERAGTKVAVANANEALKALADVIIERNEKDGVVKYIETQER